MESLRQKKPQEFITRSLICQSKVASSIEIELKSSVILMGLVVPHTPLESIRISNSIFIDQYKMKYITIFLLLLLGAKALNLCAQFNNKELECTQSDLDMCFWNPFSKTCMKSVSKSLGCNTNLNRMACLRQERDLQDNLLQCHFTEICRPLQDPSLAFCIKTISKYSCLGITNPKAFCKWTDTCLNLSDDDLDLIQSLPDETEEEDEEDESKINETVAQIVALAKSINPSGCQLIQAFSSYSDPNQGGCVQVSQELSQRISCTVPGVNELLCRQITMTSELCYFNGGRCTKLTQDSSLLYSLECSASLNKAACLAIRQTPSGNPCYWNTDDNSCASFPSDQMGTLFTSCDSTNYLISPSVCSAIVITAKPLTPCYYNQETNKCSSLCYGTGCSKLKIYGETICNLQSSEAGTETCTFNRKPTCSDVGLNRYACMIIEELCFFDGICKSTGNQDSMRCDQGLNQQLCLSLKTQYQTCYWDNQKGTCKHFTVTEKMKCETLDVQVNENVCRQVTTSSCSYDSQQKQCESRENGYCDLQGLNKIGCLDVNYQSCQWDGQRCQEIGIKEGQTCDDLKNVSYLACAFVTDTSKKYCRYDEDNSNCVGFDDLTGHQCDEPGLNEAACSSIVLESAVCYWTNSMCQYLQSDTLSCESLTNVANPAQCRYAGKTGETCVYQPSQSKCSIVIEVSWGCDQYQINKYACQKLTAKCYWDTDLMMCKDASAKLATLNCDNFCTQKTCIAITKDYEYCYWDDIFNICQSKPITDQDECDSDDQLINENVCRKLQSSKNGIEQCSYDSVKNKCGKIAPTFSMTDCNQEQKVINLVTCVTKSNANSKRCVYVDDKCTEVTADSALLATIECFQANQAACTSITQKACYWGTRCIEASKEISQDPAFTYSSKYCAITTSASYKWDETNAKCLAFSANEKVACDTVGLNLKACTINTLGNCKFDASSYQCSTTTIDLTTYNCNANYNQAACIAISTIYPTICSWTAQTCVFTQQCSMLQYRQTCIKTIKQCKWVVGNQCQIAENSLTCDSTLNQQACINSSGKCVFTTECYPGQLNSCAQPAFTLQADICARINNDLENCYYSNSQCTIFTPAEGNICEITGINRIGCLSLEDIYCQWSEVDNKCIEVSDEQTGISCNSAVTMDYCLSMDCQFDYVNKVCSSIPSVYDCIQLGMIEDGSYCEYAQTPPDKGCRYNDSTQRCSFVQTVPDCNFNNQIACGMLNDLSQYFCTFTSPQCVQQELTNLKCTEIIYQRYCVKNKILSCKWDEGGCSDALTNHDCEMTQYQVSQQYCALYSTAPCSYDFTNSKCIKRSPPSACSDATTVFDCLKLSAGCYFDKSDLECKTLSDTLLSTFTCSDAFYTSRKDCLSIAKQDSYCTYSDELYCQPANVYSLQCSDPMTSQTCTKIRTLGQMCKLVQNSCQVADLTTIKCSDNVNVHACLRTTLPGQACAWSGEKCQVSKDSDLLVSQQQCSALETKPFKWNSLYYICETPLISDGCLAVGLNRLGCLKMDDDCIWNLVSGQCSQFVKGSQTKCSDYTNVTPKVCRQIQGLSCYYDSDSNSCKEFIPTSETGCLESGLTKLSCLQITFEPCKWESEQCQKQDITTMTECQQSPESFEWLSIISNPSSCSSITYPNQSCKFYQTGCVTSFNGLTDDCDTAGLNAYGCSLVTKDSCQFYEGKCQKLSVTDYTSCQDLRLVTSGACLRVTMDPCKYSDSTYSCETPSIKDNCSQVGLNEKGCKLLESKHCKWYNDLNLCSCDALSVTDCSELDKESSCSDKDLCIWKDKKCQRFACEDITKEEECKGDVQGKTCYYFKTCTSATSCQEVKDFEQCNSLIIGKKHCQLSSDGKLCIQQECSDLDSCSPTKYVNGQLCAPRTENDEATCSSVECEDLNESECLVSQSASCYWIKDSCVYLKNCDAVNVYSGGQKLCAKVKFNENPCIWGPQDILSQTMTCQGSGCSVFSYSASLCNGKQAFDQVCTMVGSFCQSCEEIIDPCICAAQTGKCQHDGQQCRSVLCKSLPSNQCKTGIYKSRCSLLKDKCVTKCHLRNDLECTNMKECEWNKVSNVCQDYKNTTYVESSLILELIAQSSQRVLFAIGGILIIVIG